MWNIAIKSGLSHIIARQTALFFYKTIISHILSIRQNLNQHKAAKLVLYLLYVLQQAFFLCL